MSQDDLPMMPFMVKDWLTATMHWACAERGAYISLLAFQWINGNVPPDVPQLARIVGVAESEFDHLWQTIGAKFDVGEGAEGGLVNNRLEQHRKKALQLRDAHARGASAANAQRRAKRNGQHNAEYIGDAGLERALSAALGTTPTSTSSSSLREDLGKEEEVRKEEEGDVEGEGGARNAAHAQRSAQRSPRGTYWNEEKWINFKLTYPHRAGGAEWTRAKKTCIARLREGHTWEEFIAGAERYALYCAAIGKTGTEFVKQAATFLGPNKPFLETWEVSETPARNARWSPPDDDQVGEP